MNKEALKLALEALTYIYTETTADEDELIDQAITAIKEALAQPEQDYPENFIHALAFHTALSDLEPEPEQDEPYGYFRYDIRLDAWVQSRDNNKGVAFYTTPPQRKPLTRGQIREIEVDVSLNPSFDYITPAEQLCRAIEAAHGIKE